MVTLVVYLAATVATAFSFDRAGSSSSCRFLTGAGIGGEYAAINSAIDELIPARVRGRVDLIINGSFWLGAAARRARLRCVLLDTSIFAADVGWRLAFGARRGARPRRSCSCAATCPRARAGCSSTAASEEAERIVDEIERRCSEETGAGARRAGVVDHRPPAARDPASRESPDRLQALPAAHGPRPGAVRRPGVHLQRRHVRPRHAILRVLRRRPGIVPLLLRAASRSATSSARCCSGACSTPSAASR